MTSRTARWLAPALSGCLALALACSDPDNDEARGNLTSPGTGAGNGALDAGLPRGDGALQPGDEPPRSSPGPSETPDACAMIQTTPVRSVPSVTFLVDGSSSMKCVYPDDPACDCERQLRGQCVGQGSLSRWQALAQALFGDGVTPGLVESRGAAIRFGLWIYNNGPGNPVCPAFPSQVAPALDQLAALQAAFPATPPGFNTPTGLALGALAAALPNSEQATTQQLGPQKIVLATDGQPFVCYDPATLAAPALDYAGVLQATAATRSRDIDLYVMSLAPAAGDFARHLADVAQQGNTGQPYAPADKAQLSAALDEIIASAISCTVTLDGTIQSPTVCKGTATLGGQELRCGDPDGFTILDQRRVELTGEACRRFKHEPSIALGMTFPCDGLALQ